MTALDLTAPLSCLCIIPGFQTGRGREQLQVFLSIIASGNIIALREKDSNYQMALLYLFVNMFVFVHCKYVFITSTIPLQGEYEK